MVFNRIEGSSDPHMMAARWAEVLNAMYPVDGQKPTQSVANSETEAAAPVAVRRKKAQGLVDVPDSLRPAQQDVLGSAYSASSTHIPFLESPSASDGERVHHIQMQDTQTASMQTQQISTHSSSTTVNVASRTQNTAHDARLKNELLTLVQNLERAVIDAIKMQRELRENGMLDAQERIVRSQTILNSLRKQILELNQKFAEAAANSETSAWAGTFLNLFWVGSLIVYGAAVVASGGLAAIPAVASTAFAVSQGILAGTSGVNMLYGSYYERKKNEHQASLLTLDHDREQTHRTSEEALRFNSEAIKTLEQLNEMLREILKNWHHTNCIGSYIT